MEISHAGKSNDLRAGGNRQNKAILGITVIVPTSLVLDLLVKAKLQLGSTLQSSLFLLES